MEMDSHIMSAVNTLEASDIGYTSAVNRKRSRSVPSSWKKEGDSLSSHNRVSFQTDKLTTTIQE